MHKGTCASKSDEKSEGIHLVIEIQRYENADFTVKCYSYWEHDPGEARNYLYLFMQTGHFVA